MLSTFRKCFIVLFIFLGLGAAAQIPGTFPFAFLKSLSTPDTCTFRQTYYYSGTPQDFVVPADCTSLKIQAWGAGGGGGGNGAGNPGGSGGSGGYVFTTIAVTPGETLTVKVGGGGLPGMSGTTNSGAGGGGGSSQVLRGTTYLAVAAGGGGGGGQTDHNGTAGRGGSGCGEDGGGTASATGGRGGTASAGGAPGSGYGSGATAGTLNQGGKGATEANNGSAGGAGGYNGGGAGEKMAGGGGGGGGLYGGGGGGGTTHFGATYGAGGGGGGSCLGDIQEKGNGQEPYLFGGGAGAGFGGNGGATAGVAGTKGSDGWVLIMGGNPGFTPDPITISTNTTINSSNVGDYVFKDVTISTGVTVTLDLNYSNYIKLRSLEMQGTAKLTTTSLKPLFLDILNHLTMDSGSSIDVIGKGYAGGTTGVTFGNVTSGGSTGYSGGSHGGYGGSYSGTPTEVYGNLKEPETLGAGGAAASTYQKMAGGGVVRIKVGTVLTLNGLITADGDTATGSYGGAGAGGSVWITTQSLVSSSSGLNISASGGGSSGTNGSGGGGGRIAVYYGSTSGFDFNSARVQAYGGVGTMGSGGAGTIFFKKNSDLDGELLIASPQNSNHKNTKIGVFGRVAGISTSTLSVTAGILPGTNESLSGKTLKPDISQSATFSLTGNSKTSLVASVSLVGQTAVNKYFYVTDYDTVFKSLRVEGAVGLDVGYLDVKENFSWNSTGPFQAYDIQAPAMVMGTIAKFVVLGKVTVLGDLSFTTPDAAQASQIIVGGNFTVGGTPQFSVSEISVEGNFTANGSTTYTVQSITVNGSFSVNDTVKLVTPPSSTTAVTALSISAQNMFLASGATIDTDGRGYLGGDPAYTYGNVTTGGSTSYASGGSHGGYGGRSSGGVPNELYGSVTQPTTFGSGGAASSSSPKTAGGGVVRLAVTGTLTLNGSISANGISTATNYGGTGSGGSIWISADVIESSVNTLNVSASGGHSTGSSGSAGGGGRIAIYYGSLSGFSVSSARVQAYGGTGGVSGGHGGAGTIFYKQASDSYGSLLISGVNAPGYKDTKVGVFGQVGSVSTATLTALAASQALLPATNESLAGKTLKPDITISNVVTVSANTKTTLTANTTLVGLTSASKYFYITDYDTQFMNVTVEGAARLNVGYLMVQEALQVANTAVLNGYDIETKTAQVATGASLVLLRNLTASEAAVLSSTSTFTMNSIQAGILTLNNYNVTATSGISVGGLCTFNTSTVVAPAGMDVAGPLNITGGGVSTTNTLSVQGDVYLSGANLSAATLDVEGNIGLNGASTLTSSSLDVVGTVTVNNTGTLRLQTALIGGDLLLNDTSTALNHNPLTNGTVYPMNITAQNVSVASGASINGNGKGYYTGYTVGGVTSGGASGGTAGGSHGGYGGKVSGTPNEVYGSIEEPVSAGAGGGGGSTGYGGGAIKLTVTSQLTLNGKISADGNTATASSSGPGAGGSIWIIAGTISSSSSSVNISANGGATGGGSTLAGAGGGRIAIHYGTLSGFSVDTTRVQAYGSAGSGGSYFGGSGTIFYKQNSEARGDLLISNPTAPSYKNTKIGVFGQVNSVSTATLNSTLPLLPGSGISLVGKTLKPDIFLPVTFALAGNAAQSLTAVSTLVGSTSASKYFYVTDYETSFKNLAVRGAARVEAGYLNIAENLSVDGTANLSVYDVETQTTNIAAGTVFAVVRNAVSSGATSIAATGSQTMSSLQAQELYLTNANMTFTSGLSVAGLCTLDSTTVSVTGGTLDVGGDFNLNSSTLNGSVAVNVQGQLNLNATSTLTTPLISVMGHLILNNTATLRSQNVTVDEDLVVNDTATVVSYNSLSNGTFYPLNILAKTVSVAAGATINANGRGYAPTYTNGGTTSGGASTTAGGSHGGYGGKVSGTPNEVYGSIDQPTTAGAGGGGSSGGYGGGVIKITATSELFLNGLISANGNSSSGSGTGPGAGGSIWIVAPLIRSTSSALNISANGGAGTGGSTLPGAGGGRISLNYGLLNGFVVDTTRVQAYGLTGTSTSYQGGAGTIYFKQTAEALGSLLIAGPNFSNYKNTKIGVFGQVNTLSGATLNATAPLLPGAGISLAGRILKPDIMAPNTVTLTANAAQSLTADSALTGLTAASRFFYVTDYETTFKTLLVRGNSRLEAGYLNVSDELVVEGASQLHAYDIETQDLAFNSGTSGSLRRNIIATGTATLTSTSLTGVMDLDVTGALTLTNASMPNSGITTVGSLLMTGGSLNSIYMTVAGAASIDGATLTILNPLAVPVLLDVGGNLNISGASNISAMDVKVAGTTSLSGTTQLKMKTLDSVGDISLTDTAGINTYAPSASSVSDLTITAPNMVLSSGTSINVNGLGYMAGRTFGNTTTGATSASGAGASHGGYGGRQSASYTPNEVYGDFRLPQNPGAGSGAASGGGVIKLTIASQLTLNGLISANGNPGTSSSSGGAAGGSVLIHAGTLHSTVSTLAITASGGNGTGSSASGGGGGRIAIHYGALSGFTIDSTRVQAYGGSSTSYHAGAGTIFWKNNSNAQEGLLISGNARTSNYARTKLTLTEPLTLEHLKIENSAQVRQTNSTHALTINTLEIQSSGALEVPTNGAADYGAWFNYSTLIGGPVPTEY